MGKKTIMIVDDEMGIREITKKFLINIGYNAVAIGSGQEALDQLETIDPDLILLDIEMPGIDGFTVCKEVRKQSSVPIIFLTVRRETADREKCFALGADDFMTKPFQFDALKDRIKKNIAS